MCRSGMLGVRYQTVAVDLQQVMLVARYRALAIEVQQVILGARYDTLAVDVQHRYVRCMLSDTRSRCRAPVR